MNATSLFSKSPPEKNLHFPDKTELRWFLHTYYYGTQVPHEIGRYLREKGILAAIAHTLAEKPVQEMSCLVTKVLQEEEEQLREELVPHIKTSVTGALGEWKRQQSKWLPRQ